MKKIKIKQVKSSIGCVSKQKLTLEALGLRKINHEVFHNSSPQIIGMIATVKHLVAVEELD